MIEMNTDVAENINDNVSPSDSYTSLSVTPVTSGGKKRQTKRKKAKKTLRKKHSKKSRKLSKSLSSWIMHVKKFAKDHKIKYPEALKHPKCKASYKKH